MIVDVICLATLFVFAVFGYRKGFVKQIFALAGVAGVAFFSVPLAEIFEAILQKDMGFLLTGRFVRGGLLAASASLIYLFCHLVGRFLHDTLVKGIGFAESTNHILGTVLALIESAIALYFILCLTDTVQDRVKEYAPEVYNAVSQSTAFHIAQENNGLQNSAFFSKFQRKEFGNIQGKEKSGTHENDEKNAQ